MQLVTVYIPTKNRIAMLQRAIQSVKLQSYKPIELIVVDDGSTDGTVEFLIEQMAQGSLRAFFNSSSQGACASRNKAIENSMGYFVTGLDDDDYFSSDKRIEHFVDTWNTTANRFSGLFDSVAVATPKGIQTRHEIRQVQYNQLREHNFIGSQVFAPREHYVGAGLFDPVMPAWQDWDMWLRMSEKFGGFLNISQSSYMVDEMHGANRITTRNEVIIRNAMHLLRRKIKNVTLREKSSLIVALYGYPQVKPQLGEVLILLAAFRIKSVLLSIRRVIF